jgi:hypothetical protein
MRVVQRALMLTFVALTAVMTADRPAAAQTTTSDQAAIRLGIFLPTNTRIHDQVGNLFPAGGIDYTLANESRASKAIISVDFWDRNDGGRQLQVLPITVGEQFYSVNKDQTLSKTYFGFGLGGYITSVNVLDDSNFVVDKNQVEYGGYVNAGADLWEGIFVDARYHVATAIGPTNIDGLELTMGYRF